MVAIWQGFILLSSKWTILDDNSWIKGEIREKRGEKLQRATVVRIELKKATDRSWLANNIPKQNVDISQSFSFDTTINSKLNLAVFFNKYRSRNDNRAFSKIECVQFA